MLLKYMACISPVIILNPNAKYALFRYRNYWLRDTEFTVLPEELVEFAENFPYKRFSPRRLNVTHENLHRFFVKTFDGEIVPLFMEVACGKCELCRDKKARDLAFRCEAESNYSSTVPLFLTLTYNDVNKPRLGVNKDDVQRFLKRLREDFKNSNLRYLFVSEYGSKTLRPHYHAILWNFPDMPLHRKLKFIERAWSIYDFKSKKYNSIGFCYLRPISGSDGAVRYVTKYMRKDGVIPVGCNDTFALYSRGRKGEGGLGYKYALEYEQYHRLHPEILTCTLTPRYSSAKPIEVAIPQYYKNKWFPTKSRLFSRKFINAAKMVIFYRSALQFLRPLTVNPSTCSYLLSPEISSFVSRFSFLVNYYKYPPYYLKMLLNKQLTTLSADFLFLKYQRKLIDYERIFLSFDCDFDYLKQILELSQCFRDNLQTYLTLNQLDTVETQLFELKKRKKLARLKEIL